MKSKKSKGKSQKVTAVHAVLLLPFYFLIFNCAAQQTPQYTQFMLNNYGLNPAACGTSNNKYEMLTGIRRQWIGFDNPPTTTFVNFNTYFGRRTGFFHGWHGIGAYWQSDRMGTRFLTDDYYASYTYLMRIHRVGYLAFGMAAGARRYGFRITDFRDPVLNSKNIWLYPDFIPGVKFWNNIWTFDLSVKQLYKFQVKQGGGQVGSPSKLPPHLYFSAARKWWPRSHLLVLQSLHVKYNFATLPSFDYNMLAFLNKNFAVGMSYRHLDALAGIVQFRYDRLVIGIAYDYAIAPYRIGFANTQEIMLGLSPSSYYEGGMYESQRYKTAECPAFQFQY